MLLGNGMNMGSYPAALDAVAKAFASHKDLIIGGQNPLYQETIIVLILNQVHLPKSDLMDICEGFVKSSADSLKQIGATVLLNDQPARSELKPLVLAALNHSHWMIRKMAITALSNTQKTTAEENQLLQKIDDSDSDVRAEAIKAAAKISVTDAHLPTAISLSTAKNWEVRVEAAKLLGRINTPQATHSLIGMMDDSDSDVRNQANSLLNQKKLDDSRSDDLKQQMKSTNWEVRRESALLLGKIGSDKATLVLIGNLDDSDADVRTAIVSILSKTTIKDSFIQPLSDMYKATDWEVRRNVSTLLAKNTSGAATKSLIAHMGDADSDVQAAINSALENRTLAGDMVDDLKTQFSNNDWGIRQEVAKLLGKIKTKESLAALEAQLAKETDSDVKTQLEKSIQAVKS
jgi:HEAT repeat protein